MIDCLSKGISLSIKDRIIENDIVSEEDWDDLTEEHKKLAEIFLYFLENFDNDYNYDEEDFQNKFIKMQDKLDLEEFDLVKDDNAKLEDLKSFNMRIPKSIVKFMENNLFSKEIWNVNNFYWFFYLFFIWYLLTW